MFRDVMQCEEMLNDIGFWYAKCKCPRDIMQVQMQDEDYGMQNEG